MQDHVWVIQQLVDGKWVNYETRNTRDIARIRSKFIAMQTRAKTRIRKFIAA
jgi:hypothetical protein